MIIVQKTIVSADIFEKKFVCDLIKCKGSCCIEGDSGAPLEDSEIEFLENNLNKISPYLEADAKKDIKKKGVYEVASDGDKVTTCRPDGACNFSIVKDGIYSCAIQQAFRDGKIDFEKPISCHLYPIRTTKYETFEAVNYHSWDICKPACKQGDALKVPVYKFLKGPLVRKFGEEYYKELEEVGEAFLKK